MAKVTTKVLYFTPGAGGDAFAFRIRSGEPNSAPEYTPDYEDVPVGNVGPGKSPGEVSINLVDLDLFKDVEGAKDINVTAVDEAGNESDFLEIDNVLFDFNPPEAPTAGRVE